MIKYILKFIPLLLSTVLTFCSLFSANYDRLQSDIEEQKTRIASLEQAYQNGEIAPVDEAVFFDGNLEEALADGIKFNELRYIATHNSYQTEAVDEYKKIYINLSELTFGLVSEKSGMFVSPTVTEQLSNGVYSLEIDIETFDRNGEISFTCMHSPTLDMTTSCYDFSLLLKEISMWSDNNPNHLPITIIIEPKSFFIPLEDMEFFNFDYALALDSALRAGLGDKLFTPADMLRDYESFGAMRAADDWCKVSDMLGKVLILLHDCSVTQKYIEIDPSIKSQAMFPMLRENDAELDYASFLLINDPKKAFGSSGEIIEDDKFVVRTRADSFTSVSEKKRDFALESGAQIVSTDYPVKSDLQEGDYFLAFCDKKTISPR